MKFALIIVAALVATGCGRSFKEPVPGSLSAQLQRIAQAQDVIISNENALSIRLAALQASIDERPTMDQFYQYETNQTRLTLDSIDDINNTAANDRLFLNLSSRDTANRFAALENSVSNILVEQSMQGFDLQNIADYLQNQALLRKLQQTTNHIHR